MLITTIGCAPMKTRFLKFEERVTLKGQKTKQDQLFSYSHSLQAIEGMVPSIIAYTIPRKFTTSFIQPDFKNFSITPVWMGARFPVKTPAYPSTYAAMSPSAVTP